MLILIIRTNISSLIRHITLILFLFSTLVATTANLAYGEKNQNPFAPNASIHNYIKGSFTTLEKPVTGSNNVTIGIYGINICDLDLNSNTYHLSAYVWMKWNGNSDPTKSLEFVNMVENSGAIKKILLDSPTILKNGEKYQIMRIEGSFFQPFDLKNYPLDQQELSLYIENSGQTYDKVDYFSETESTGYDSNMIIPGWHLKGVNVKSYIHDYKTAFGEKGNSNASKYSSLKYSFQLQRDTNFFLWKLFAPLIIVLMTNWLALLLKPTFLEVRIAMTTTALLTIIFMQQTALDAIPQCSTLMFIDKVYLLAYLFVLITLLQIILVNFHLEKISFSKISKMRKIDIIFFIVQVTLFSVIFSIFIMRL